MNSPQPVTPHVLKGEVCGQFIRCNKHGCRCQNGQPHGPYYYRVWREGGNVRKTYVRPEDLADVRAACDAYRAYRLQLRELRRQREALVSGIRRQWRQAQRFLHHA